MHNDVRFWRWAGPQAVGLLRARFRRHEFGRHTHGEYTIGIIEHLSQGFTLAGRDYVADAGDIVLINPETAHDGRTIGPGGYAYRVFYLDSAMIGDILGRPLASAPAFTDCVIRNSPLARRLSLLHRSLDADANFLLEEEAGLASVMGALFVAHASWSEVVHRQVWDGLDDKRVRRLRDLVEDCIEENFSLADLSRVAGIGRRHLNRIFLRAFGLPPHEYALQAKLRRARQFLQQGMPGAAVAARLGFADQSHFIRRFKQVYGYSPGALIG